MSSRSGVVVIILIGLAACIVLLTPSTRNNKAEPSQQQQQQHIERNSNVAVVAEQKATTSTPATTSASPPQLINASNNSNSTSEFLAFVEQLQRTVRKAQQSVENELKALPNNPEFSNCAPRLGRVDPPPHCTPQNPCTNVIPMPFLLPVITTPTFGEDLRCEGNVLHPTKFRFEFFSDGPARSILVDTAGQKLRRYYCRFVPTFNKKLATSTTARQQKRRRKVPLVIVFPGTASNCSMVYPLSPWRAWAKMWNFALVAVQGMNRHWPASGLIGTREDGSKWDYVSRNVSKNEDVQFLDAVIDEIVGSARKSRRSGDDDDVDDNSAEIDRDRIYLAGGSNGFMFATFYGMIRSGSTDGGALGVIAGQTTAGNKIAAVAGHSGLDPFVGFGWKANCWTIPRPKSKLPVIVVSRVCDVMRCEKVSEFMRVLREECGSKFTEHYLLDEAGNRVDSDKCVELRKQHSCDGFKDLTGHGNAPLSFIPTMLHFFRNHTSR